MNGETQHNMNDITSDFTCLKVSALCKASRISDAVRHVTIGPDSVLIPDYHVDNENIENEPNNGITKEVRPQPRSQSPKISTRSGITFSIKKILLENEVQRREEVKQNMQRRLQSMMRAEAELREQMAVIRNMMIADREHQESLEKDEIARLEAEEEHVAQQNEIKRKHEQQLHAQRILERKEKLEREVEEQRIRNQEKQVLFEKMLPLHASFTSTYQNISTVSKSCKDRNILGPAFAPHSVKLKELSKRMEGLLERAKSGELTEEDVNTAESLAKHSESILNTFKQEIDRINATYDAEVARREEEVRQAQAQMQLMASKAQEAAVQPDQSPSESSIQSTGVEGQITANASEENRAPETTNQTHLSVESVVPESKTDDLLEFVDKVSLHTYLDSQQLLENHKIMCSPLTQSESTKKFRFECQKAINIPVNAISGVSREHLMDKYEKLHNLLGGKPPTNANQHPQGIQFCKHTLAKKFVNQGEALVSSKPEMAFSIAAVIVALWNDYPDFGELLLAYFYKTCPYLVPIFLPQQQGQSNEDYYKSLGYKYSEDGTVERQDKFLKRMSGLMRLYAALTVTRQRKLVTSSHPHGLQNAWRWLAAILNIEPRPDICATLILDMLEVTGHALWKTYPKQFPKLLALLITQYYPRMHSIGGTAGGPLARLEQFLKNSLTKGSIPPPDGQLPQNFW
ncbi:mRNA export factor Gle1 isoform X1 [Neodiprion virginianus]|uniref:mRNA export factor Gle1 isoform X1 n=1 Tax=Neodiprion virginianus TaxID=2961670 RepID=UPI001EE6E79A|nr:mRNA export factor Gle1 isoform X1 [Neodiprion virginianus]